MAITDLAASFRNLAEGARRVLWGVLIVLVLGRKIANLDLSRLPASG